MKKRKKKKFGKKKHYLLKTVIVIVALIVIAALVSLKVFRIDNVNVSGNEVYDASVIESAVLNDKLSWNGLYVYLKYTFTDTDPIPFVDTVEFDLDITDPHTLNINVYEKGRMGYIYVPELGQNVYFDKDGIVIEISSEEVSDVPRVSGIECDEVVLYERLPIGAQQLRDITSLTQSLKREELVPYSIEYGVKNGPMLTYGNVDVTIGDMTNITQKIERLKAILPSIEGRSGILHLEDWTEETTNIVFDVVD